MRIVLDSEEVCKIVYSYLEDMFPNSEILVNKNNISDVIAVVEPSQKIPVPSVSDAIKFRIDQYGMSQRDFCKQFNINASILSDVINGKRELSKNLAKSLERAGIPPTVLYNGLVR